jgi:hypothetical protein
VTLGARAKSSRLQNCASRCLPEGGLRAAGPLPDAITADLYTHVNLGLGKAAAEQIARALKPASPAVPTASLPQTPENASQEGGDTDAQT